MMGGVGEIVGTKRCRETRFASWRPVFITVLVLAHI